MFQEISSLASLIKDLNSMGIDNGSIITIVLVLVSFFALLNFNKSKFAQIDKQFEAVDKKFSHIDKKFDHIDKKFDHIDKKFDDVEKRFSKLDLRLEGLSKRIHKIELCITEIQTVLATKFKFTFNHVVLDFGNAFSPIKLKDEYRRHIVEGKLDEQLKKDEVLNRLIAWLAAKNPETGLDAQNYIMDLVLTTKINDYLSLKDFRKDIYEQGLTESAADAILALYLFEEVIPKVITDA